MTAKRAKKAQFLQQAAALALITSVLGATSTDANDAQVVTATISRAVVADLSEVEQKLPQSMMLSRRAAGGDSMTASAVTQDGVSAQAVSEQRLYKISGEDPIQERRTTLPLHDGYRPKLQGRGAVIKLFQYLFENEFNQ